MARRPNLTDEERDRIAELREQGLTEGQIALKIGCSQGSVSWALLRLGVDLHADRALPPVPTEPIVARRGSHVVRRFTQEEDAELLRLEASGMITWRISKKLGRRNNSVIGRLRTLARREARAEAQS